MRAGIHNIEAEQGVTFSRTLDYKDSAGVIIDLSTYSAKMEVRKDEVPTSQAPLLSLSTTTSGLTVAATAPNVTILVSATSMAGLPIGSWYYDLEVAVTGVVTRILQGRFEVAP